MRQYSTVSFFTVLLLLMVWACNPDDTITTDSNAKLSYSLDTLTFDTVFTRVGSATRTLKIRNTNNEAVQINRIFAQENSRFRFNVDGVPGSTFENVIVPAEDSIYVFVEVTVNPDQDVSASPFVIEEDLTVEYNGNTDAVKLIAWGQNANYFPVFNGQGLSTLTTCQLGKIVWDDPKPYVLYGIIVLDSCTLEIPAGARIHVWGGLAKVNIDNQTIQYNDGLLVINADGKLDIKGTAEAPVHISGTRLEANFDRERGQWAGIRTSPGGTINIEHAIIEQANIGIYADSASTVSLKNTIIKHTAAEGMVGVNARIRAENTLIHNNSSHSFASVFGGDYEFNHCTLANYGNNAPSIRLLNFKCNQQEQCFALPLRAVFTNSIIGGSQADEIALEDGLGDKAFFNYSFDHCLLRYKELVTQVGFEDFESFVTNSTNYALSDSLFIDETLDYRLSTESIAIDKAISPATVSQDLDGSSRNGTADIGCYEAE